MIDDVILETSLMLVAGKAAAGLVESTVSLPLGVINMTSRVAT